MTLKAFHILFIVLSVLLALLLGTWSLRQHSGQGGGGYLVLGVSSFGVGLALLVYGLWFVRKTRGMGES